MCPSMPGSRQGAVIAATWATMMYFGEAGRGRYFVLRLVTGETVASLPKSCTLMIYTNYFF